MLSKSITTTSSELSSIFMLTTLKLNASLNTGLSVHLTVFVFRFSTRLSGDLRHNFTYGSASTDRICTLIVVAVCKFRLSQINHQRLVRQLYAYKTCILQWIYTQHTFFCVYGIFMTVNKYCKWPITLKHANQLANTLVMSHDQAQLCRYRFQDTWDLKVCIVGHVYLMIVAFERTKINPKNTSKLEL